MQQLKLTIENKVGILTISRPPANALSYSLMEELSNKLNEIERNDQIRTVLLHGEGRFFSAGADIKEFTEITSASEAKRLAVNGQNTLKKIENFPKAIIAAIHGAALGGGLELAMACHIRLVSEDAKLGLPELQLGIIPGFAGTQRLPKYVGLAKAAEMILTSEAISGLEAVQWGLANHAYPETVLFEKAKEMAEKISQQSPASIKAIIDILFQNQPLSDVAGSELEATAFSELFMTQDAKEGIAAFIEKRKPTFTGK